MTAELRLLNTVYVSVLLFLLPLILMIVLYGLVIRNLWLGIQLETQGMTQASVVSRTFQRLTQSSNYDNVPFSY